MLRVTWLFLAATLARNAVAATDPEAEECQAEAAVPASKQARALLSTKSEVRHSGTHAGTHGQKHPRLKKHREEDEDDDLTESFRHGATWGASESLPEAHHHAAQKAGRIYAWPKGVKEPIPVDSQDAASWIRLSSAEHMVDGHLAASLSTYAILVCVGAAIALLATAFGLSKTVARPAASEDDVEEDCQPTGPPQFAKYVAEFIGTFMLVFSVGCNVLVGNPTWGVLSIACTLMVCIYALGHVSGGNFNPAVSVSLALSQKLPWGDAMVYVCVQLAAGITAGLCYGLMLGKTFNLNPLAGGFTWWQAGLAELLYTLMLCFVVLNVACSKKHAGKEQFYGLAIGFVIVAGGYGAGSISGGCFNPAVAMGIDASSIDQGFGWCAAYMVFELTGAALAAALFRIMRPGDFCSDEEWGDRPTPLVSRLISEFLGTYMLVLTVGLNVLQKDPKAAVFSIAASLMCMIYALGSVSGAHFNPAVTTAILCSGRNLISVTDAGLYVASQVTGGVCAAATYAAMYGGRTVPLQPAAGIMEACCGEAIFTFLLAFVVLCVATIQNPLSEYFGLAIGSCVTVGGLAIGSLSGGSLNPAVSAGLALTDGLNGGPLRYLVSYTLAELLGGVAAAGAFIATHPAEYIKSM